MTYCDNDLSRAGLGGVRDRVGRDGPILRETKSVFEKEKMMSETEVRRLHDEIAMLRGLIEAHNRVARAVQKENAKPLREKLKDAGMTLPPGYDGSEIFE